jgi:hypothetical protein
VHLFVRKTPKVDGRAAPFFYCGECEFLGWDGDRPITIRWKLKSPVPERWRGVLDVPTPPAIRPGTRAPFSHSSGDMVKE